MKANAIKMEVAIALPADTYDHQGRRSSKRHCKKTRRSRKRKSKSFSQIAVNEHQPKSSPPRPLYPELPDGGQSEHHIAVEGGGQTVSSSIETDVTFPVAFCNNHLSEQHPPMLRPVAPNAPNNFTQFLMDEHEDSNLYFSFETPRAVAPRVRRSTDGTTSSTRSETSGSPEPYSFATYDADDYESPDDLDTTAFFAKDFELSYQRVHEEELSLLTRNDLLNKFIDLEERALTLDKNGAERGRAEEPEHLISRLQDDLLKLQEENAVLKKSNRALSKNHRYEPYLRLARDNDERSLTPEPPPGSPRSDYEDESGEMLMDNEETDRCCAGNERCNLGYCSCNDSDHDNCDFEVGQARTGGGSPCPGEADTQE